ncbi:TonB-dependent receptor [Herbaspirillum sp. WKF16]|uniref:TonB-dependent receptor n=1 Tax=Herbaspirillum sp. WKF16 TaxID=3028312 RepID=UPI0023A9AA17|nr:TonB-dependent receptor [Herbaspirillum sp. WKF16]WDZ97239.1 TonB-dependent receptor [Herbaspirillum sp. WKF16]
MSRINAPMPNRPQPSTANHIYSKQPRFRPMVMAIHLALAGTLGAAAFIPTVYAQTAAAELRHYDIPAGPLQTALNRFSSDAGIFLAGDSSLAREKSSPGLKGDFTVSQALEALLAGTGLQAVKLGDGGYGLRASPEAQRTDGGSLPVVAVSAQRDTAGDIAAKGALPAPYAGGQVARGGRVGMLGNKDVMDTPFNTVSYTSDLILDQQAKSVSDVLANNPSVRIIYPDNDGSTDYFVRGNKVSQLDIGYDGLYGIGTPGIESLERIDVLIGANALLNGLGPSGGVGAMINQVPKKALETPLTRLTFSWISDSQIGGAVDLSRRFGADNQFGIRVNAAYRDGDLPVDRQSRKVTTATVALDWRGRDARISSNFGYRENDNQSPARTTYLLTNTFQIPPPPADSARNWQNTWTYDNSKTRFATLRGEYDISPAVTAYVAIGGSKMTEEELFANTFLTSSNGAIARRTVYWPLYRNSWSAEAGLRGSLRTGAVKHGWSVVASQIAVTNGIALNDLGVTASNIYNPVYFNQPSIAGLRDANNVHKTGDTNLTGLALSDTLSVLDDKLQWTVGLRQQNVATKSYDEASQALTGRYDKGRLTYATGLTLRPTNNLSLYTNYIEGLQPGATVGAGYTNAGQVFAPYVSRQFEIGAKYDFGGFLTTLNAYQISTPNAQANGAIYTIDGRQRTEGIELNTYGEVARNVRLLGGLVLTDARQVNTANGANNGKRVQGAAEVQANLGAEWDFAPGFTVSGRTLYTGREYIDAGNLQAIPGSIRYDAGLRYKTMIGGHPTALRFNVENLTDKSYWVGGQGFLIQSRPRTFSLSASVDL